MMLMNRSPYFSLLFKPLTFIPRRRPADAAVFLSTRSYSAASEAPQSSFMAEYLVSSCGFDPDEAAKASKLLGLIEFRHQAASVLQDLGFSFSDITHLVSSKNTFIRHKPHTILSKIELWQGLLGSNDLLVKLCKKSRWFLGHSIEKRIQPNIEILRDCGITGQKLSVIIRHNPFVITQKAETLKASISRVEGLGVARTSGMFHLILMSLTCVSEKNFEAHLEFFKGFGWSEDDFVAAFRMAPTLVRCSLKSLQRKMEFLINEIRCTPSYLANRPVILLYSLEKRLIPRYRILTGLKSRGVKVSNLQMVTYMRYTEKKFLEKFGVSRMH
ncbi:hypothetical protein GW17_00051050 [Ensete ventricosum]|nr:hypothetical protein GW17_00051050 [Ensete ventricosum]